MRILGTGNTKLILFGEHAAIYGYPAIGLGLPWRVTVSLTPSERLKWATENIDTRYSKKLNTLLHQVTENFPELSSKPPVEIHINAEAPIGIGLGSSGALCVALARSMFSYLEKDAQYASENARLAAIWQCAHDFEKNFHITPSGIDTGLAAFGKLCYFKAVGKELPECHIIEDSKMYLVIGAVPRISDTGDLVSNLRLQKEKNKDFEILIAQLGKIADDAIQYFLYPPKYLSEEIGRLANEAQKNLSALKLSTPDCDEMLAFGLSNGALGGKISGAGGGGAYFLIAENETQAEAIASSLRDFSLRNEIRHVLPPVSLYSLFD